MKKQKKIFQSNGKQEKARVAIHISSKTDFELNGQKMVNASRRYNDGKHLCT